MTFQVIVCTEKGRKMTIDLNSSKSKATVQELKIKIAAKLPRGTGSLTEDMKLIFADKRLEKDHKRLSDYGIVHMSIIHMVLSLEGGLV